MSPSLYPLATGEAVLAPRLPAGTRGGRGLPYSPVAAGIICASATLHLESHFAGLALDKSNIVPAQSLSVR